MAGELLTPNMNMPEPGVGVTSGPQWAIDLNNCLTIIDSHNHAPGSGVQINPNGMNINSDLPFNNNNLTLARSLRLNPQGSNLSGSSDLGCIYESGVDLYYNDGAGNQIRITQSGAVAGTPGSISNLVSPASASYSVATGTFIFQSNTNTPANIDGGSFILRNITANSKGLTLNPPNAMGADYALTLPSLPGATNLVTLDSVGNIEAITNVDNSTLQLTSNLLSIKDQGVTQAKLAARSISSTAAPAGGVLVTASSGSFTTLSGVYVDVTNMTGSLVCTGRPVHMVIQPITGAAGDIEMVTPGATVFIAILRNSSIIFEGKYVEPIGAWNGPVLLDYNAPAGTNTYNVQVKTNTGTLAVTNMVLVAYET